MNQYELNILIDRTTAEQLYLYCQTEARDPFQFASNIIKEFMEKVYETPEANILRELHKAAPLIYN